MKTNEEMARQLHEWYLEATDQDGSRYNPEAVVPYDDLPEGSKIIDRYIAEKVLQECDERVRGVVERIERQIALVADPRIAIQLERASLTPTPNKTTEV